MAFEKKAKCRATRCLIFQFNNIEENTRIELNIEPDRTHMDITNGKVAAKLNRELSAEAAANKKFFVTGAAASHLKVKSVTYCKDRNCKRVEAAIYGDKKTSHFYFFKSYLISLRFDKGDMIPFLQLEVRSQSIADESRFFEYTLGSDITVEAEYEIAQPLSEFEYPIPFQFFALVPQLPSVDVTPREQRNTEELVIEEMEEYFRNSPPPVADPCEPFADILSESPFSYFNPGAYSPLVEDIII